MTFNKNCEMCEQEFVSSVYNKKTCSPECNLKRRKKYREARHKKLLKDKKQNFICKGCGTSVTRYRIRNGFCTRTCASKYYYNNGKYSSWKDAGIKLAKSKIKPLVEMKCVICNKKYHIKQKEFKRNRSKTCSNECKYIMLSNNFSGEGNPFFGKSHSNKSKSKQIKTLYRNFGVKNAFSLSNRKTKSKGQVKLYESILEKLPKENILIEKKVFGHNKKEYFADILVPNKKVIIEYNGDFWHCNPEKYDKNYYNPKKKKYAYEIWEHDKTRSEALEKNGYKIIVVWENDFKKNRIEIINKIIGEING